MSFHMKNKAIHNLTLFLYIVCSISLTNKLFSQVPSDLMENCEQWKITYPTGVEDKTLCNEPNNEFFYLNNTEDAIVFKVPISSNNGSTPNSDYIRSELRERESDGSGDIYWTTEGKHFLYVKQAITHLPINKPHLVATQIHGNKDDGIDDSMVMRLEDSHLFLSFNGGKLREDLTIKTNYNLGDIHEVIFLVEDGKHYCYYAEDGNLLNSYKNGTASNYLIKDGANDFVMDLNYDETYFKVGNYTQSNPEKEETDTDDPNNYGEVLVYDFSVEHDDEAVTGVLLTPASLNLSVGGSYQLTNTISPSNATNKSVTYTSSNTNIATVNSSGIVTGIGLGTSTITATTDEGNYSDFSTITVIENPQGTNIVLNKTASSTGLHEGDNEISNINDGLTSSRWSVSGFPQSAIIDLGTSYNIGRTELICYGDRAYQFIVSTSDIENGSYTEIVNRSQNTTEGTEESPITDIFTGVNGRYLKISVSGAAEYDGSWVSLLEFRAYEATLLSSNNILSEDDHCTLWPNPTSNWIHVNSDQSFHNANVYDQTGKIIVRFPIVNNSMDVSSLKTGIYTFEINSDTKISRKKVIIK